MTTTPHDRLVREDADGAPHLAYFAESTSFVWSGSAERPVQVCPGGAGEPVADVFWLEVAGAGDGSDVRPPVSWMPLHHMLNEFRRACDQYLRDGGGSDARLAN